MKIRLTNLKLFALGLVLLATPTNRAVASVYDVTNAGQQALGYTNYFGDVIYGSPNYYELQDDVEQLAYLIADFIDDANAAYNDSQIAYEYQELQGYYDQMDQLVEEYLQYYQDYTADEAWENVQMSFQTLHQTVVNLFYERRFTVNFRFPSFRNRMGFRRPSHWDRPVIVVRPGGHVGRFRPGRRPGDFGRPGWGRPHRPGRPGNGGNHGGGHHGGGNHGGVRPGGGHGGGHHGGGNHGGGHHGGVRPGGGNHGGGHHGGGVDRDRDRDHGRPGGGHGGGGVGRDRDRDGGRPGGGHGGGGGRRRPR